MTDKMPDEILALKKDKPDQPPDGVCLMHGEVRGWNWAIDHLYDRGLIHSDTKYKALQERCERLEKCLSNLVGAEKDYRKVHDIKGDGHTATGMAWDFMRKCSLEAEKTLQTIKEMSDG